MSARRNRVLFSVLGVLLVGVGAWFVRGTSVAEKAGEPQATPHAAPAPAERERPSSKAVAREEPSDISRSELRKPSGPGKHKVLLQASFGPGADQLGTEKPPGGEGATEGPTSFLALPDGRMMVLDSLKHRIAVYGADGRLERTLPVSLKSPGDMVLGKNGDVVVMDRWGEQALEVVGADGKVKAKFKVPVSTTSGELYAAGDDLYVDEGGKSLRVARLAEASGAAPVEGPAGGLYAQKGKVVGKVAPDGATVTSTSIHDRKAGEFLVTASRGARGEQLFSRLFTADRAVGGVQNLGFDANGKMYVLYTPFQGSSVLLCLDAESGEQLGSVELPRGRGPVEMVRSHRVVETGGIVKAIQSPDERVSYEFFDCE